MARADELEERASALAQKLATEFADLGDDVRWLVTRALVHRAVHFATEKPGVEFCALATYLGEMITHAHKLAHGENPKAQSHKDVVH
jgi:hypothetical protein